MTRRVIIGIPGPWQDPGELISALARASLPEPRYLAAGGVLVDIKTGKSFELHWYDPDPGLQEAFMYAGQGRFSGEELRAIGDHRQTVYILGPDLSVETARDLLEVGALLLDAGGLGVKVETSGLAHPREVWRYYARKKDPLALYDAYVTPVGGDSLVYTCGMHNFVLPDVSMAPLDEPPHSRSASILHAFNQWHLLESPSPGEGHWFGVAQGEEKFRLSHRPFGYHPEDLLNNPFGRWHLEPTALEPPASETLRPRAEPLVMVISHDDPEVAAATQRARDTFPLFVEHFLCPYDYGHYLVKSRITEGEESILLWLLVVEASLASVTAVVFEIPPEFGRHPCGTRLELTRDEILDWRITRNGTLLGGFSARMVRDRIPPEERLQYDLYTGTISYAPLP
ncbi:MAG: DUF2314 domain-containing protein [Armatimonadetes bacterium]|nr:DUF2314 domain-containing protein [Armatimonadota bacterium]